MVEGGWTNGREIHELIEGESSEDHTITANGDSHQGTFVPVDNNDAKTTRWARSGASWRGRRRRSAERSRR